MKKPEINLGNSSVAAFFQSTDGQPNKKEKTLPIDQLVDFHDHPFKPYDDVKTQQMVESIKTHGVLSPVLVRVKNDQYEIIAGHNRTRCAKLAGLSEVPVNILDVTDDAAIMMMVETNFAQRETIFPSERALAYKMQVDALNRQGQKQDPSFSQIGKKTNAYEQAAEINGLSRNQLHRFIRLLSLIPELLQWVDDETLSVSMGAELSYLDPLQQRFIFSLMQEENTKLNTKKLDQLRKLHKDGLLTNDDIESILLDPAAASAPKTIKIAYAEIERFDIPDDELTETIVKALDLYLNQI